MACSSPYATFRADAWMRQSQIFPRKVMGEAVVSAPQCSPRGKARASGSGAVVQGELFLFPVIVAC